MVTADIERALCRSPKYCAIAISIYRQLEIEVGRVRVTTAGVSIAKNGYRYYYKVPHPACRLVHEFDDGKKVKPISFTLLLADRRKIQNVTEERRHQVNKARREREQARKEAGIKPKVYQRYGIPLAING